MMWAGLGRYNFADAYGVTATPQTSLAERPGRHGPGCYRRQRVDAAAKRLLRLPRRFTRLILGRSRRRQRGLMLWQMMATKRARPLLAEGLLTPRPRRRLSHLHHFSCISAAKGRGRQQPPILMRPDGQPMIKRARR